MTERARDVLCGVFGATTGFSLHRFVGGKTQQIIKAEIPFGKGPDGLKYWPTGWLQHILHAAAAYGGRESLLALATWGADSALLTRTGHIFTSHIIHPAQHYGSVPKSWLGQATAHVSALDIYRRTGGANVAWFQPYAQLLCEKQHRPQLLAWPAKVAVIPMADLMTCILTGAKGHDQTTLQSYGMLEKGWRGLYGQLFPQMGKAALAGRIAPWPVFDQRTILPGPGGIRVIPATHDSVPARMVGFSQCPFVLWTGNWVGTAFNLADSPGVQPSAESLAADIAFEGVGPARAAITNIAMLGTYWKALLEWAQGPQKTDYQQGAASALEALDKGLEVDLAEILPAQSEQIDQIAVRLGSVCAVSDWPVKLATFIKSAAKACDQKLQATAKVLGLDKPTEVAIIGGWAENAAFVAALCSLGYAVHIPPLAAEATHAGLAAQALVRGNEAPDFGEALKMLQAA